jgi:hypothetical protein
VKTKLQSKTAGELQSWFQNLRTTYKLKLPHPTEGGADQPAASERQKKKEKKKKKNAIQPPGKTTTEFLLKYKHKDWMLEE